MPSLHIDHGRRSSRRPSLLRTLLMGLCLAAGLAQAQPPAPVGPPGRLYLPEVANDTIAVIDTATAKITERIRVPFPAARPAVMAATLDGSKLYVDNFGLVPATISVIDRKSGGVKTVPVESTPLGAFTSLDGSEIYLPEVGFVVEVVSTKTDTVVRRLRFPDIPVSSISGPDGKLYVGFQSGLLGVYDPLTGAEIKRPIWSGGLGPFWFSFTADGRKLYVDTVNQIGVIDVANWMLTKTISTNTSGVYRPSDPGAFVSTLSPDGTKLYVTVFGDTGLRVLDVATDKIVKVIPTTGSTTSVMFSADGTRGYISDLGPSSAKFKGPLGEVVLFGNLVTLGLLGPGQVIVFDPKTDQTVGAPIPTQAGPGVPAWVPLL